MDLGRNFHQLDNTILLLESTILKIIDKAETCMKGIPFSCPKGAKKSNRGVRLFTDLFKGQV